MTKIFNTYLGDGQVKIMHEPTSKTIVTDLPPDNGGQGREFSPTDLFASSLAACALTIMGKMAERRGDDFSGASMVIDKIMADNPRRVGKFIIEVTFPAHFDAQKKDMYMASFKSCPVHNSLHPDIQTEFKVN